MIRAAFIGFLLCVTSVAVAREPDNPCPTCCAQLKDMHDQMEAARIAAGNAPRLDKQEIELAIKAGLPGDPVAEWHCMVLVQKLKAAAGLD